MAKDVSFFLAQVTGALVVNAAEAMALADALQEKVAALEAQVKTLTAELDATRAHPHIGSSLDREPIGSRG